MVDIKSMAAATAPREFELSYTTTIEDVYEKTPSCDAPNTLDKYGAVIKGINISSI